MRDEDAMEAQILAIQTENDCLADAYKDEVKETEWYRCRYFRYRARYRILLALASLEGSAILWLAGVPLIAVLIALGMCALWAFMGATFSDIVALSRRR